MYSWRAYLGLINPGSGPNMEQDFHRFLPRGVALSTTRVPFTESIAKRMIKYLLFARSHEIWQREIL